MWGHQNLWSSENKRVLITQIILKTFPKIYFPNNYSDVKKIISTKKNFLFQGNGNSYGDTGSNNHLLVSMKNFKKIIHFDKEKGIIEVESGLLLKELLETIVPLGWFIPVTPGSKYVSTGGMVAKQRSRKKY